ncbi:MAG: efflux transporter outer membrane subunit [Pseudoxanthomonas sp.]
MRRPERVLAWLALAAALAGCSLAPTYQRPRQALPQAYEAVSAADQAAAAPPAGDWWTIFHDPQLDALQAQLAAANPDLAAAVAHYDAARAAAGQVSAARLPQADLQGSALRNRQSDHRPLRSSSLYEYYDADTVQLSLGWDLDLWGRLRNAAAAAHAQAEASGDDLAAARLSLQQQLTRTYLELRGLDTRARILEASLDDYRQALEMTRRLFDGGLVSELDVARARHQLASAGTELDQTRAARDLARHAIAALVGQPASGFVLEPDPQPLAQPAVPAALPSELLQRRPDIAAAERRVYAANAGIGVARAAWFPRLSLTGAGGYQNAGQGQLLEYGNRFFALGPSLDLHLFDGGKRTAARAAAQAEFDAAAAQYRATVLAAIGQVEDQLSVLAQSEQEVRDQQEAVDAAQRTQQIAQDRYQAGGASYLEVVSAQTDARQAQLALQALLTRRLQASAALMAALGGGWQAPEHDPHG